MPNQLIKLLKDRLNLLDAHNYTSHVRWSNKFEFYLLTSSYTNRKSWLINAELQKQDENFIQGHATMRFCAKYDIPFIKINQRKDEIFTH